MSSWEKPIIRKERLQQRRKTPSFSSSLLEAIYQSIDESKEEEKCQTENHVPNKTNNTVEPEQEITSLRRAILIEKWMESYKYTQSSRHFSSDSSSSTDSSMFSSSETESSLFRALPKPTRQVREIIVRSENVVTLSTETTPKCEGGRFMRTKTRALKIYGDLKKVKQPISPAGKIANFLNSLFNSRNMKKNHHHHHHHHHHDEQGMEDWSSVRKSRSVNDTSSTVTCSLASRSSCLNKSNPSSTKGKSKRSVRFCPVSVIVDEDCQPCGHKNNNNNNNRLSVISKVGSGEGSMYADLTPTFKKAERVFPEDPRICGHKNIYKNEEPRIWHGPKVGSFRNFEGKHINKNQYRGFYEIEDEEEEEDDSRSCASSDLFELENIGMISHVHATRNELPVYGTTSLKMNQAIARGLVM